MSQEFIDLVFYFVFYAVLGWCVEVVFYTVTTGKFVNRGFLNGPICPIYGISCCFAIVALQPIQGNLFILFFCSMAIATVIEFLTGFLLEKIFNDKWWDYSDEPFNFRGYICLRFSLLWGLGCTVMMRILQPMVCAVTEHIPYNASVILVIVILVLVLSDTAVTIAAIRKLRVQLRLLRDISERMKQFSDYVGGGISDVALNVAEKTEKSREKLEADLEERKAQYQTDFAERREKLQDDIAGYKQRASAAAAEIREKYRKLREKNSFTQSRLEKAFPRLKLQKHSGFMTTSAFKEKIAELIAKYKD